MSARLEPSRMQLTSRRGRFAPMTSGSSSALVTAASVTVRPVAADRNRQRHAREASVGREKKSLKGTSALRGMRWWHAVWRAASEAISVPKRLTSSAEGVVVGMAASLRGVWRTVPGNH